MSRQQTEELQARVRNLERVNEALLTANEGLKDRAAPLEAKQFIEQRDKARAQLAEVRNERDDFGKKLRAAMDRISRESNADFNTFNELVATRRERDKAQARVLHLEARLSLAEMMNSPRLAGGLSQDIWRRLVQLCHPDKHNGSKASTEATRWLMENRP